MPQHTPSSLVPGQHRLVIVAARFNDFIVDRLLDAAVETFSQLGGDPDFLTVSRVPGAFELPVAARRYADTGDYDAVVTLGCVIRGETDHYDHVVEQTAKGIKDAAVLTGVPVAFGVLTCDNLEQAIHRAGGKHGNMGRQAMLAALEMANLLSDVPLTQSDDASKAEQAQDASSESESSDAPFLRLTGSLKSSTPQPPSPPTSHAHTTGDRQAQAVRDLSHPPPPSSSTPHVDASGDSPNPADQPTPPASHDNQRPDFPAQASDADPSEDPDIAPELTQSLPTNADHKQARRVVRRLAMQALYQLDMTTTRATPQVPDAANLAEQLDAEFDPDDHARLLAAQLALEAFHTRKAADAAITALSPDWPSHRQPPVDRAILRLAYHELTTGRVAPAIAMNEAVELAKAFADAPSPIFINGVLDRLAKSITLPEPANQPAPPQSPDDWLQDAVTTEP